MVVVMMIVTGAMVVVMMATVDGGGFDEFYSLIMVDGVECIDLGHNNIVPDHRNDSCRV